MKAGCPRRFLFRKRSLVLFCVLVIVCLVVLDGRDRCFGFELEIFGRVPDLNQHAVVYAAYRKGDPAAVKAPRTVYRYIAEMRKDGRMPQAA